jgi:hypothetical protein
MMVKGEESFKTRGSHQLRSYSRTQVTGLTKLGPELNWGREGKKKRSITR